MNIYQPTYASSKHYNQFSEHVKFFATWH